MIRDNLRVVQSRQKSSTDTRRRELVFEIGDYVYLKVAPMRSVRRFNMKGKLAPRYIGPFKILERRGEVAYQLELLEFVRCTRYVPCVSIKEMFVYTRGADIVRRTHS